MAPIAGFTRLRKHQFTRQGAFGTAAPATKAYPFSGTPSNELNWTDSTADQGSRDPIAPPVRVAPDLTAALTVPELGYNSLPIIHSAFFGGQVEPTGGGTAKTWLYTPASLTVDELDPFTYQFGDDVLTDWFQLRDGILESFEISGPEGLGPLTGSMGWRFGNVRSTGSTDSPVVGTVPTPGLNVDPTEAKVFLKDGAIFIADSEAGLAANQVSDALHAFTLRGSQEVDQKRFANGTQTFDVSEYGPGARSIEFEATFAKTADTVGTGSESDDWMADEAVTRYVRMVFTSAVVAQAAATFYSWQFTMPMRYYTRTEGESGQNSTVVLTGHAFYDPDDADFVFESTIVNTLTEAELGGVGS